ncbi:hypothetical protein B0H14DRAFT_2433197 [Mycena olivaceomarginata]|nr:hypothetical protein B0H14DRAFT_2433197 [Mycena olivaceomarginata]
MTFRCSTMALPSILTNFAPNASTCSAATKPSYLRAHRAKSPCTERMPVAHWPAHKAECKALKANRLAYVEKTGKTSAPPDLTAWIK